MPAISEATLDIERVLAAAKSHVGLGETAAHANSGLYVEFLLKACGLAAGNPWCMAFVSHVGKAALGDDEGPKSRWIVPYSAACRVAGSFAEKQGVLMKTPERGDLFLVWFPELDGGRFGHVGFVLKVYADGSFLSIEGNSNDDGSRDGWKVVKKRRKLDPAKGHRFVRWAKLRRVPAPPALAA